MPQYSPDPILAAAAKTATLPPKGTPHGIALPGSQQPGYSAVYRHYRVGTGDILRTADPSVRLYPLCLCRALRLAGPLTSGADRDHV